MSKAITQELILRRDYLAGDQVNTIYFGGGTPSVLSIQELSNLIQTIRENFPVHSSPEITLEANPDDLSADKLRDLFSIGINRLSIGIQSFDDDELKFLNRPHSGSDAIQCVQNARASGFANISIDLIYGIPNQSTTRWEQMIDTALELRPEHISAYSLTIEEKTVFGKWAAKGKLKPVDDDVAASALIMLVDKLTRAGYLHYEVSNFAKPGFISQHNSNYWKHEKYLGVGPSAHSHNLSTREFNVANNAIYLQAIGEGSVPSEVEDLTLEDQTNDYILTGLRTMWGIDIEYILKKFQYDLPEEKKKYIEDITAGGLATVQEGHLILTKTGKMLADKIATDLFVIK